MTRPRAHLGGAGLRWAAIAIAVLAAIDPSITVSARARPRIAVVSPAWSGTETVVRLSRDFEVVSPGDPSAAATVVVGDRYPDVEIAAEERVATVNAADGRSRGFVSFSAPRSVPPGSMIHLEAEVPGRRGTSRDLIATIGDAIVASASHTWSDDRPWRASLDVVPVGEPPYAITVSSPDMANGPRATAVVEVVERLPVLVYEARPSWAASFVRRALENDSRFVVSGSDAVSKGISVRTRDRQPGLADLDRLRVVIVGGLDALTASDTAALNRFMIERGGSVALIPDSRDVGRMLAEPAALSNALQKEVLLERPAPLVTDAPLPRIDASELLTFAPPAGARVLARTEAAPIVWTVPRGEGRLMVSGAMDAWRFRTAGGVEFDRFWTSAVAGLALAVRPTMSVDMLSPREPGGETRVRVRMRDVDPSQPVSAAATLASGETVRLWPGPEPGSFDGLVSAARAGLNRIDVVATNGRRVERGSARFADGAYIPSGGEPVVPLSLLSATHGGIDVTVDELPKLVRWLRDTVPAKTTPVQRHPMRSPWWIVPFAGCLSVDWWLRRRSGLR
jgi:hypothetical protein